MNCGQHQHCSWLFCYLRKLPSPVHRTMQYHRDTLKECCYASLKTVSDLTPRNQVISILLWQETCPAKSWREHNLERMTAVQLMGSDDNQHLEQVYWIASGTWRSLRQQLYKSTGGKFLIPMDAPLPPKSSIPLGTGLSSGVECNKETGSML